MNNILTFEDYKKMNIRQVESVIYRQFIEENIKEEVNEGLIRKAINKAASKFIQSALEDEIKKGKELEKSIKDALDGLDKGFDDIKQKINANNKDKDPDSKLAAIEKVKEAIKAVQSQAFDTLTMIGSEGEIDFAGFLGSGSVIAAAHFGILFSPISSIFMTRKAYKYFLGIIKQTIRRNLLIIQLNFDQFENLILQKSFESEEDSEFMTKIVTLNDIMNSLTAQLCDGKNKFLKGSKNKELKDKFEIIRKTTEQAYRQKKADLQSNPLRSLWEDQHNNTYTRTLEQIKQYINDDSQKELDALKNSIIKMAGNDVDLVPYGELMISAAEEYAVHTNHGINNNFIKMSSVFNLENQKKLIELIQETQKENEIEIEKRKNEIDDEKLKKDIEEKTEKGKELYEDKLKGKKYTFDEFEKEFDSEDIKCLNAFFKSDDGKDEYKELTKTPLYKYLLDDTIALNDLYDSMSELNVVEINSIKDFSDLFVEKKQALYYLMSGRSIKDAVRKKGSDNYFGFNIENNALSKTDENYLDNSFVESNEVSNIFSIFISPKKHNEKKRYFLKFNGSGDNIFKILHTDFNTKIFKNTEYNDNISIKNKEVLLKIIQKNLNIGKSISTQLSEYLVMLEAHMLLKQQKPWFVVKDSKTLFDNDCFKKGAKKIENVNAFIEIDPDDYSSIKKFLDTLKELKDNDFNKIEPDNK